MLIGGACRRARRYGACVGPPDTIVKGSATVLIMVDPQRRMGDTCAHGGSIVLGLPTVMIEVEHARCLFSKHVAANVLVTSQESER